MQQSVGGGWRAVAIVLLLMLYGTGHATIGVSILGERTTISPAPQIDDGVLLGAPEAIVGRLGCRFMTDDDGSLVIVTPKGTSVTLTPGHNTILVDDQPIEMSRETFTAGERIIAPLRPILEAIGVRQWWDSRSKTLHIEIPLQQVEVHADGDGARIRVPTALRSHGTLAFINDPDRYYVDLPGVRAAQDEELVYVNEGNLRRVRWGNFKRDPVITRVVLDVREGAAVRWEPDEDGFGGYLLLDESEGEKPLIDRRLPEITRLAASNPDSRSTIVHLELTDPVSVEYDLHRQPPRMTLKLPDATPAAPMTPIEVDDSPFVKTATLTGTPGRAGAVLTLDLHQLIHFEVESNDDPSAIHVVFRKGRLADKRIVIDPGHGGRDTGARGRQLLEKDVVLDVSHRVAARLLAIGASTTLTRETDVFVDLYDRPRLANRLGADLFVSIHVNAMPRRNQGRGIETYYRHPHQKCLGLIMQAELVRALERRCRGLRQANFVVIRETEMPAVLVELMFINSDEEEALLARSDTRDRAADAIVEGLRQYVEGTGTAAERLKRDM